MKMTKFDRLMKVYFELSEEFQVLEDEMAKTILNSWATSFKQMDTFLEAKEVRRSQMNSGLEQGLRELPELLSDLPKEERELALSKLYRVMDNNIPDFY
jgi:hypothetical protein